MLPAAKPPEVTESVAPGSTFTPEMLAPSALITPPAERTSGVRLRIAPGAEVRLATLAPAATFRVAPAFKIRLFATPPDARLSTPPEATVSASA